MPSVDRLIASQERAQDEAELGRGASRIMPKSGYTASVYDSNMYNVRGYAYPDDLMETSEYGGNRVIFYINVSVDSRVVKSTGGDGYSNIGTVGNDNVQRDQRGSLVGQKVSVAQAAGASALKTAAGAALAGELTVKKGAEAAAVGGFLGGGGTALIASNTSSTSETTFTRPQKRLQAAIALYVPNQLSIRYSAGWSEEETAQFSAIASGAGEIIRAFQGDANLKRTGGIAQSVLTSAALGGLGVSSPVGYSAEMGIAAGLAANPKKEQAFKNVDFRTFTFEYQFAPRSEEEARNALNIIKAFKYHMHPEYKSPDNFLYIYPSEFDIVYYKGKNENLKIHRHTSCVLTEMNVNYTPNGVFTTFPDGTPTQINVSLTFKELMLLTKEAIERYA